MMGGDVTRVVRNCVMIMACGYLLQSAVYSEQGSIALFGGGSSTDSTDSSEQVLMYPFIGMIMILSIFQYSLGTAITAATSSLVPRNMQGTLMGLEHSLFAVAYMVGPRLGVAGLAWGDVRYVTIGLFCCSLCVARF